MLLLIGAFDDTFVDTSLDCVDTLLLLLISWLSPLLLILPLLSPILVSPLDTVGSQLLLLASDDENGVMSAGVGPVIGFDISIDNISGRLVHFHSAG